MGCFDNSMVVIIKKGDTLDQKTFPQGPSCFFSFPVTSDGGMKTLFYITILVGSLMLPALDGVRVAAVVLVKNVTSEVMRLVVSGDYAEIRSVDGEDFEEVINEAKRVVIVVFHRELRASSRGEADELDAAVKKLPGRVLVAKIKAEENRELLDRLSISVMPTVRIYQSGRMVRNFEGGVGKDELISAVNRCLDHSNSGKSGPGYIGPMEKDWLPQGVQRTSSKFKGSTGSLE